MESTKSTMQTAPSDDGQAGPARRLKRMRSSARQSNDQLQYDLQASIHHDQRSSVKRSRLSCSVNEAGSPLLSPPRYARPTERSRRERVSALPPAVSAEHAKVAVGGEYGRKPSAEAAPTGLGISGVVKSAFNPVWTSVSGVFGRDRRSVSTSSTSSSNRTSSIRRGLSRFELVPEQPRQSNNNLFAPASPRDSGISMGGGSNNASNDIKNNPLGISSGASPQIALRAALNHSPSAHLVPASQPVSDSSPLRRLHRASMSSLKRVRSRLGIQSAHRADNEPVEPVPPVPPVPAIPSAAHTSVTSPPAVLKPQPSRAELKKRKKLIRRMSSLQGQLDEARLEYTRLFGEPTDPDVATDEAQGAPGPTPAVKPSSELTAKDASMKPPMSPEASIAPQDMAEPSNEPSQVISPSKIGLALTALPQFPSDIATTGPKRLLDEDNIKNDADNDEMDITTGASVEATDVEPERSRRSLSTIFSSDEDDGGAAKEAKASATSKVASPRRTPRAAFRRQQAVAERRARKNSLSGRDSADGDGEDEEEGDGDAEADEDDTNALKVRSAAAAAMAARRPSRIPRQSPRRQQQQRTRNMNGYGELPVLQTDRVGGAAGSAASPLAKRRSETEGVNKRHRTSNGATGNSASKRKSVGTEQSGHYGHDGQWVWGPDAF